MSTLDNNILKAKKLRSDKDKDEAENWPPKFTFTPHGAAALFLAHMDEETAVGILEELLKAYWRGGYDAAENGKARA